MPGGPSAPRKPVAQRDSPTGGAVEVKPDLQYDYTAVGHVTVDVLADGSRRPGGSAFYSALQAARLGLRALVVTRGRPVEIEALLEPHRHELDVRVLAAEHTTTLRTSGLGSQRRQQVLCWAGALPADIEVDTDILHIGPVARETPLAWHGRAGFLGLTPQGLARTWDADGQVRLVAVAGGDPALALAARCDALVISEHERESCAALVAAATGAGAIVAITAGERPTAILAPGAEALAVPVLAQASPVVDDLGAGDVFAAALFVALREGQPPPEAARFAHAAAATRTQGAGARAIGTRAEVLAGLSGRAPARPGAKAPGS